ncbi:hypothetical protein PAXRUDRAFT_832742 [Paxillus rubicundulus Ve08.2h10]|uniref:Uncharacterized protein n=1 Tax=Paxillus rubicundulus Ve08.2h10 TaxID=930991 RepID=A0A0D0DJ06_9AGAM|nr:hypothetical protein PAXRUDRAFT_832742 [Paxillus rubicundulus Ve08.2h10]
MHKNTACKFGAPNAHVLCHWASTTSHATSVGPRERMADALTQVWVRKMFRPGPETTARDVVTQTIWPA